MKSPLLTLLLSLTLFHTRSQTRDVGQQIIKKKCTTVHAHLTPKEGGQHYPLLFDSIRVSDLRSDTSRIGLVKKGGHAQKQILLDGPATAQLTSYLNAGFTAPTAKHRLLVVIKDLWVSDPDASQVNMVREHCAISFRFEAYLASGSGYTPLTYMDTTATYAGSSTELVIAHRLPELIALFMDKAADHTLLDDRTAKRVVSYKQIDSFARSRFDYAMDTATRLVTGVYATVDEFRNNAPSILKYEIKKGKDSLMELHIPDENGQMYYTHKVWGFCDGEHIFVMMDGNVFPVFPVGHQFYVLGSKEYLNKQMWVPFFLPLGGGFAYGTTAVSDNVIRKLQLFRLNIQSGEVTE